MNDLQRQLIAAFNSEYPEHLQGVRSALTGLATAADEARGPLLEEALRRAHTLKGAARAADLTAVEVLAHRMEALFGRVRDGSLAPDETVRGVVTRVLDAIEDWLAALERNHIASVPTDVLEAVDTLLGVAHAPEPGSDPASPDASADTVAPTVQLAPARRSESLQINAESLENLFHSLSELLAETQRQAHVLREIQALGGSIAELAREWETARKEAGPVLRAISVHPEYRAVASYLDASGHRIRSMWKQARAVTLLEQRSSWSLRVVSLKLQGDVHRICMVPAQTVFLGFRKMVRDLAREAGKDVEFEAYGLDVEADRMVLQALKDPLMHLLRNSLSHGIESPEERVETGKPPTGVIRLTLEAVGSRLLVTVDDDGRGIDLDKVQRLARERLIIGIEESPSRDEIRRLIFRPGFSTADEVTHLSGRGIGLSVVQHDVARLSGEVDVVDREGPGTRFRLSVPITAATSRILLVRSGGRVFGVPLHGIDRLHRVARRDVASVEGKPSILVSGAPMRLVKLSDLVGIPGDAEADTTSHLLIVVLKARGRRVAVSVEAFLDEKESQIRDLGSIANRNEVVLGANLLEDGSIAISLDPAGLIAAVDGSKPVLEMTTAADSTRVPGIRPAARRRLLVVDDSITTRTLEKSILEAHGYDVSLAVDGVEALERLRAETFDLIITDLEMPRLNGFGLVEAIKQEPRLAELPVIMVTSRDSDSDRERGLALGADAYVVKQKFDQTDLLETVQQLL